MSNRMSFYVEGEPRLAEPYHLNGIGLPDVYLLNGVTVEDDPDHGRLITIADLPGLHRAIGLHIVTKHEPMTGVELRFLRKQLRLTQEALALRLRVDVQTVANYEKGKTGMGAADVVVRLLYLLTLPVFVRELMDAVAAMAPDPQIPERERQKIAGPWHDEGMRVAA